LHLQEVYAELGYGAGDFPVAGEISRRILPQPMYPDLTDVRAEYVIATIRQFSGAQMESSLAIPGEREFASLSITMRAERKRRGKLTRGGELNYERI
jgi:hypothetical protein